MTRLPQLVSRNTSAIVITWDAWCNPPDLGDGPVSEYFVYYRPEGDAWSTVRDAALTTTLTSLEPNTLHQIMVLPIHTEGVAGFGSAPLNVSTCGGEQSK